MENRTIKTLRHDDHRKPCAAFTLLELGVILAVLALLAATLLPALARSAINSRSYQCLNNNRRLCVAWRMYADDNRDLIVYSSDDGSTVANPLNQHAWTLTHMDFSPGNRANWDITYDLIKRPLWAYSAGNSEMYRCPSDTSYVVVNGVPMPRVRSMSMNLYLGGFAGTTAGIPSVSAYRIFLKTTELTTPGPAKTFVFLDQRWDQINWGNFFTDMTGYNSSPAAYTLQDYPNMIHDNACSFAFADGRAELHRWVDPRTTPRLNTFEFSSAAPSPRNPDVAWLQDHATRPR